MLGAYKGAIIRNRRPEQEKSRFCVTWRQLCSFFWGISPRLSGYSQVGRFPSVWIHSTPLSLHPSAHEVCMSSISLFFFLFFLLEDAAQIQAHYLIQKLLFTPDRSACFDKAAWIISAENDHLSTEWDTQDKRLHAAVIFSLWETSVGPPTFHSFGRKADRICVYGLIIRNRWRLEHGSCTLNWELKHSIFYTGHSATQVHTVCRDFSVTRR